MNRLLVFVVSALVASSAICFAAVPQPTSPALRTALTSLLNASWNKSADGLVIAEKNHVAAKQAAPSDPRVDYALALVQFRYLRYSDAERTLDRLTQSSPTFLPALQARIYLDVLMKRHAAAVAKLGTLHDRILAQRIAEVPAQERREAVEFLGRVLGYYEGPASKSVPQASVADLRSKILETLDTDDRDAFSAAFGGVVDRFAQLDDDKRRSQAEAKDAEARQKELDLQRLQGEKAGVAAEQASLQAQAEEAQARAQQQVDELDRQIAPLDAEYARINAQGAVIRNTIAQLNLSISAALAQADAEEDPGLRGALLGRANLLSIEARRHEINYQALDAQAAQVLAQRNVLYQQKAGVISQYEATAKRLGVQGAKLNRNQNRITIEQKKALKPSTGFSPQVQDKATATASITTYVPFPLEEERAKLLKSLE